MQLMKSIRILSVLLSISVFTFMMAPSLSATELFDSAYKEYHKGISAKTMHERTVFFEKSLELYMTVFNEYKSQGKMNSMLCYNIGNCYFNLKQIGYAVYYYKMGLKLDPGNDTIADNLSIALEKRVYPIDIQPNAVLEILLFFHYKISTSKRINYLIGLSCITAVFFLMNMFRRKTVFFYISGIAFSAFLCISASLLFEYYAPDHQGVIVQTDNIRKDSGKGFAPITPRPLGEGSLVKVISLENEWYKIMIADGKKGYVKKESVKVII